MRRAIATTIVAAALCGGLAGGLIALLVDSDSAASGSVGASTPAAHAASSPGTLTAAQTYRRDAPGVVVITATETQKVPATVFGPASTRSVQSLGSGFVIDRRGDILTNDHVVAGAKGVRVGFSGGSSYPATIVGTDPTTDLAVVRVDAPASALHPLAFDDSASAAVGDQVYAIGNPFGLDRTMTAGIVSATGRDIQAPNNLTIPNAIQTDAPINHGNSGGPLLDGNGRVVGVNSQIEGGTVDANVGVGFAIPSNTARSVSEQLIAHGRVEHGWLGVEVQTIDPGVSKAVRGLPPHGVVVAHVDRNSPAAKAGIHAATHQVTVNGATAPLGGDAIVAVDGKPVHTSTQLADAIASGKPGDRIRLTTVRGGSTRHVVVTLAGPPSRQQ
jgi:S1-C subfamily serine protease